METPPVVKTVRDALYSLLDKAKLDLARRRYPREVRYDRITALTYTQDALNLLSTGRAEQVEAAGQALVRAEERLLGRNKGSWVAKANVLYRRAKRQQRLAEEPWSPEALEAHTPMAHPAASRRGPELRLSAQERDHYRHTGEAPRRFGLAIEHTAPVETSRLRSRRHTRGAYGTPAQVVNSGRAAKTPLPSPHVAVDRRR
jgi:hypothetical protein